MQGFEDKEIKKLLNLTFWLINLISIVLIFCLGIGLATSFTVINNFLLNRSNIYLLNYNFLPIDVILLSAFLFLPLFIISYFMVKKITLEVPEFFDEGGI
jgi:hypothetical protein